MRACVEIAYTSGDRGIAAGSGREGPLRQGGLQARATHSSVMRQDGEGDVCNASPRPTYASVAIFVWFTPLIIFKPNFKFLIPCSQDHIHGVCTNFKMKATRSAVFCRKILWVRIFFLLLWYNKVYPLKGGRSIQKIYLLHFLYLFSGVLSFPRNVPAPRHFS